MASPTAAFVIGDPISQSKSPVIHGHWLEKYGIKGSYQAVHVIPGKLENFLEELATGKKWLGGNVTIPHKEAVFDWLKARPQNAKLTKTAEQLHAVNTLYFQGETLVGDNTDGFGFLSNLDERAPGWDGDLSRTVILGAGGAARAVVMAVTGRQSPKDKLVIANRTQNRAIRLVADLGLTDVAVSGLDELDEHLSRATCLINTTSIGMGSSESRESLALSTLPGSAFVTDIVYSPLNTPLLKVAQERGCRTADGLGMLLHQARPGFEAWFGAKPEVTPELRSLVFEEMGLAEGT
jgi:shikimate dehydrogenase